MTAEEAEYWERATWGKKGLQGSQEVALHVAGSVFP